MYLPGLRLSVTALRPAGERGGGAEHLRAFRDRDVVFDRAHVRHRDRHRARLRRQQLGVVGQLGPGDAERELGVRWGSAGSGCWPQGLLCRRPGRTVAVAGGGGRPPPGLRSRRRCRRRRGAGRGRLRGAPLRARSSPPRRLPRPWPLRSSSGLPEVATAATSVPATSSTVIAITSRSPRELVGKSGRRVPIPSDRPNAHTTSTPPTM